MHGILIQKLAERCAFERTAVRLHELLLAKLQSAGAFERAGHHGPSRHQVLTFRNDELNHLQLACSALLILGVDPKRVGACQRIRGVSSTTLERLLTNRQTEIIEAIHVILIAELEDRAGWVELAELCEELGPPELALRFREVVAAEEVHFQAARSWLAWETAARARVSEGIEEAVASG